jgi:hypothetical protein
MVRLDMRRLILVMIITVCTVGIQQPSKAAVPISLYEHSLSAVVKASSSVAVTSSWDKGSPVLGTLIPGERLLVEGRDGDTTWLRVHTYLGFGYLLSSAVQIQGDINRLPVVDGNLPLKVLPDPVEPNDPIEYPILPQMTDYTHQIYRRGLEMGNRPQVFSKVGDCMTADLNLFLGRFGTKNYNLREFSYLQPLVDYYSQFPPRDDAQNSFRMQSYATETGFNASSVEDPVWLSGKVCPRGDTPLSCEYRLSKPAIAIIMFGTNDIGALSPVQFDYFLRLVTFDTIDRGIIPLLSTFPGYPGREERANLINQIIIQIGRDYDVPVLNLYLALEPLPDHGRNPKSMYLSWVPNRLTSDFTEGNLKYGHTMRNLVTLEALNILWQEVLQKS